MENQVVFYDHQVTFLLDISAYPFSSLQATFHCSIMAAVSGSKAYDPKKHLTDSGHATPRSSARPGTVLEEFVHEDDRPVIAIDLDDVLSQTNEAVAECEFPVYNDAVTQERDEI